MFQLHYFKRLSTDYETYDVSILNLRLLDVGGQIGLHCQQPDTLIIMIIQCVCCRYYYLPSNVHLPSSLVTEPELHFLDSFGVICSPMTRVLASEMGRVVLCGQRL